MWCGRKNVTKAAPSPPKLRNRRAVTLSAQETCCNAIANNKNKNKFEVTVIR